MKKIITLIFSSAVILLSACNEKPSNDYGFSLPEGDAVSGQLVFIELGCIQCHTLAGTELFDEERRIDEETQVFVEIGGTSTKLQTYADLVTSIINPNHRLADGYTPQEITLDGKSKMVSFNETMRVSELIDLVTFLKSKYELQSVPLTVYPGYILK